LPVSVSKEFDPQAAKFCEPVMKANSSQGFTASVADNLGIESKPLRVYSQVKYGSVARADADVFMKFPKAGYKEKIWDHAAGVIIVEEAGGVVTDAGGAARAPHGRGVQVVVVVAALERSAGACVNRGR
jgi:3'(2'), 5'-bisphosphate nucleotidase